MWTWMIALGGDVFVSTRYSACSDRGFFCEEGDNLKGFSRGRRPVWYAESGPKIFRKAPRPIPLSGDGHRIRSLLCGWFSF
jgi:hypothetical protein